MKRYGSLLLICSFGILLSACGSGEGEVTDTSISDDPAPETDISETVIYIASENETAEIIAEAEETVQTASREDIQDIIDSTEMPEIIISENMSDEEIMLAGETAAVYFADASEEFFGYGIENIWKTENEDEDVILLDGIDGIAPYLVNRSYRRAAGYYTDKGNGVYAPMDYAAAREFMISRIGLTERGFDELCQNSPSNYIGINGELYINSGDGGQAGTSYCEIIGYEFGDGTVTFNCQMVGSAEEWGYAEDLIEPFYFRLALDNGVWKLDGCSYGEYFFGPGWLETAVTDK